MPKLETPTGEAYRPLQEAFDYFNDRLFRNEIDQCLLTLQRKNVRVLGYVNEVGFQRAGKSTAVMELAMNPTHLLTRSTIDVLSTLVHEMSHLHQAKHGKPGRKGYHNKEWGALMIKIGLHPSSTGKPGGSQVGQKMSHYIIADGPFHSYATALIQNGFSLLWGDRLLDPDDADADPSDQGAKRAPQKPQNGSNRYRFTCPKCASKAWGKPSLLVMCGACRLDMKPA